ncbi:MAG: OsmC family protein, partial [Gemmatimonadota bacterium]
LLVASLAACSAADVVDILRKGRQDVRGLEVGTRAERRVDPPRRLTRVAMEFRVYGDVDPKKAERAAALSFEKYCSVYHSLRDDIALDWTVSVVATGPDPSP